MVQRDHIKCFLFNRLTSKVNKCFRPPECVGRVARVVGEVLLLDLPDDQRVLAPAALHVPVKVNSKIKIASSIMKSDTFLQVNETQQDII